MPKVHNIGPNHFIQYTKFPYDWGTKVVVKGWTQEIEEPYRTSEPFIVRLPNYHALVLGKWSGMKNEEEALNGALERRDVTYDDFTEEAGWTPAPDTGGEAGRQDIYSRFDLMDGAVDVYIGQELDKVAKTSE
jgi:hypothetical protein